MRNIVTDRIQKKEVWMHASCYVLKETVAFLWKYTDGDFSHVCGVWHKVRSNEACTDWNNYSTCYPLMNYFVFSVLYPDRVDFSLDEMAKDFYSRYYEVDFTDEEIGYMMNGLSPLGEATCSY